ncbi:MAG: phosphomannomutase/phosphoglucomutase [bacterium]|nr:phosphomannomutase/phosphoglucomutase [bacterium]
MKISDNIFRGYDIRGLADTELSDENVVTISRGYATYLISRRIYDTVLGRDCRLSSPRIHKIVVKELIESGITVYDIGMTITQMAYWASYYFRSKGLMMITASHNPKEYNGFKLGTGFSETMVTEEIIAFRDLVQKGEFKSLDKKGEYIEQDVFKEYMVDLFRRVPTSTIGKFKVVVDSLSGSTGPFLPEILRMAGCEVVERNTKPDGNFPTGTPDPTESEHLERLAKDVVKEGADLGFSYDTDGDRVGIVDNKGNLLWNDILVSIFARDVLEFMPGSSIVFNTLCSKQVSEIIELDGGKPVIWMTGHSFIKAKVREIRAPFGGELSGHFFFMDNFYGHDDGAIASLRVLAYLTRRGKSLSEVVDELPKYISSPEIKLGLADDVKFQLINNEIKRDIENLYPDGEYITIDGVRMDTRDRMLIIRASQNGPYITIKFEAKQQADYNEMKTQIEAMLKKYDQIKFDEGVNIHAFK